MKKLVREFFFLRKGERLALVLVLILILTSIGIRIGVTHMPEAENATDTSFFAQMKDLQNKVEETKKQAKQPTNGQVIHKMIPKALSPFPFDPNTISPDSLEKMNMSGYISGNILRYREAGGVFRQREDLLKIYGMDQSVYEVLAPYIEIVVRDSVYPKEQRIMKDSLTVIDLNLADTMQLLSIPMIGPSYTKRIMKYRDMLGGYVDFNQLWEVYGMDSIRYSALRKYTHLDSINIRTIPLNTATFKELVSHPYISKAECYAILQYRDYVDSLSSVDELEINQIIDPDRFKLMRPYLEVNLSQYSSKMP